MPERSITKMLAGLEDLLFGRGTVNQARAGGTYQVSKLSVPWVITDVAELSTIDSDKHPFVCLITGAQALTIYEYVPGTGYVEATLTNRTQRVVGEFYLTASATTSIITDTVPTKLIGTTTAGDILEGFSHTSGRLVNISGKTQRVTAHSCVVVEESNVSTLHFWFARSGEIIEKSRCILPASTATAPRTAVLNSIIDVAPNQFLEVYVANMDDLDDLVAASYSMVLTA